MSDWADKIATKIIEDWINKPWDWKVYRLRDAIADELRDVAAEPHD